MNMTISDKLLSGYPYRIKGGLTINTGIGGAKLLIDALRDIGMSDERIGEELEVFVEGLWVPLNYVIHKTNKTP